MIVAVLVDTLRPGTGGTASVLELAEAIASLGNEVHLIVIRYDPQSSRHLRRLSARSFKIWYVPGIALTWDATGFWRQSFAVVRPLGLPGMRRFARNIADWWGHRRQSVMKNSMAVLARAGCVIKAASLTGAQLAGLRAKTTASIIQNHAGSVEAYERFWLQEAHRPPLADPDDSLYVAFCRGFDCILFQSPSQAAVCAAQHPDLKTRVAVVIPGCDECAIDLARTQASPYRESEIAIVVVGTVQARKRQALAVDVLIQLRTLGVPVRLHIVGSADVAPAYTKFVRKKAAEAGVAADLVLHGHRDDYLRYLAHAAVLLITSEAEGVPRVVREAMRASVPIVSTRLEGIADLLRTPGEIQLADSDDAKEIAAKVLPLLHDIELRGRVGRAARSRFDKCCARTIYQRRISQLLSSLKTGQ